jgi:hypothetical protein
MYSQSRIHPKVRTYHSVCNIHLRRILLSFGDLSALAAIIADAATAVAATGAVFAGLARTFARGRSFGRRGGALAVLLFLQLKKEGKSEEGLRN